MLVWAEREKEVIVNMLHPPSILLFCLNVDSRKGFEHWEVIKYYTDRENLTRLLYEVWLNYTTYYFTLSLDSQGGGRNDKTVIIYNRKGS